MSADPRRIEAGRRRGWLLAAAVLLCAAACGAFWLVPYAPGSWHQVWTITVTHADRSATSEGFGLGRCGEEGAYGATEAKRGALGRACFAAHLCPGDEVCDCAATAVVRARCAAAQGSGPTRLGDRITVPIH